MSPGGIRIPFEKLAIPDSSLLPHKLLSHIQLVNAYLFTQGTWLLGTQPRGQTWELVWWGGDKDQNKETIFWLINATEKTKLYINDVDCIWKDHQVWGDNPWIELWLVQRSQHTKGKGWRENFPGRQSRKCLIEPCLMCSRFGQPQWLGVEQLIEWQAGQRYSKYTTATLTSGQTPWLLHGETKERQGVQGENGNSHPKKEAAWSWLM